MTFDESPAPYRFDSANVTFQWVASRGEPTEVRGVYEFDLDRALAERPTPGTRPTTSRVAVALVPEPDHPRGHNAAIRVDLLMNKRAFKVGYLPMMDAAELQPLLYPLLLRSRVLMVAPATVWRGDRGGRSLTVHLPFVEDVLPGNAGKPGIRLVPHGIWRDLSVTDEDHEAMAMARAYAPRFGSLVATLTRATAPTRTGQRREGIAIHIDGRYLMTARTNSWRDRIIDAEAAGEMLGAHLRVYDDACLIGDVYEGAYAVQTFVDPDLSAVRPARPIDVYQDSEQWVSEWPELDFDASWGRHGWPERADDEEDEDDFV